jgi:DNA repair exonuclease SbcCD ATPase subunit
MSISASATAEKRSLQAHLESSLGQLRQQLLQTQEELDEFRAKDMQGPGIAMLEEVNALQDEVQMLRAQLRSKGGGV